MPKPDAEKLAIPLLPGVREDVRQLAQPGTLVRAENVRFWMDRTVPRGAARAVSPAVVGSQFKVYQNSSPVNLLGRVGDSNVLGIDGVLFARDGAADACHAAGAFSTARPLATRRQTNSSPGRVLGQTRGAVAASNANGYVAYAVLTVSGAILLSIDGPSGARVFSSTYSAVVVSKIRICAVGTGDAFCLVYQSGTGLNYITFSVSAGVTSVLSSASPWGLTAAGAYWDISAYGTSSEILIAYQSGAATMTLARYDVVGASLTSSTTFAVAGVCPVSVYYASSNDRAWVGWLDNPTVTGQPSYRAYTVAAPWSLVVGPGTLGVAGANVSGCPLFGAGFETGSVFWVHQRSNNGTTPFTRATQFGWFDSGSPPSQEILNYTVWHVTPISKPDSRGRFWALTANESTNWIYSRAVLLRARHQDPNVINGVTTSTAPVLELALDESVAPRVTADMPSRTYDFWAALAVSANATLAMVPQVLQQGPGTLETIAFQLISYVPAESQPHRKLEDFGIYAVAAGQPTAFFGDNSSRRLDPISGAVIDNTQFAAYEVGFAYRPAVLANTPQAGGNLTALGAYQWVFVFEWSDATGRRHRSAPSAPFSLTLTGANQQVQFSISSLEFSQRLSNESASPVVIAYRTTAGNSDFYREVSFASASSAAGTNGVVTYTSGSSAQQTDALISTSEVVYTAGGVQENKLAPACSYMCRTADRLAVAGGFNGSVIEFSKSIIPTEPVQFANSSAFQVVLPETCTGIAYQDGTLFAFGARSIYAINGDGPDDQGNGTFSTPEPISLDVGCIDYRSIVSTSDGIYFRGDRGFYLLPRGGGVPQFLSLPIDQSMSSYPYVLGAAYSADQSYRTVRFLLSSSQYLASAGTQRVAVRDLEFDVWSFDTYSRKIQQIGSWSAEPLLGNSAGHVLAFSDLSSTSLACAYWDQGASAFDKDLSNQASIAEIYTPLVETAVIRPWGVAGWGTFYALQILLSKTSGSPTLSSTLFFDGNSVGAISWSPASNAEESYHEHVPQGSRCSGFRVRLTAQPLNGAADVAWHALQVTHRDDGERRTDSTERS